MDDYVLLLDQTAPYLNSQFCEIPQEIQARISQAGMGDQKEPVNEKYDVAYIKAEGRFLYATEAEGIKEGDGIEKFKWERTKWEHYYIWDTLSLIEREYEVAKYDFKNYPGFREKAASSKLTESIAPYLETDFSDLPQEIKMKIAFVDPFQHWDEKNINRYEIASSFDNHMLHDNESECLICLYGIKEEWDKHARKKVLLADEAIPLMNGSDPESWKECKNNQKDLHIDMIRSIDRCLKIAEAEEKRIATPSEWLVWGRIHDLDKPTIRSDKQPDKPDVCMWKCFESAVNRHSEQPEARNADNNGRRQHQQEDEILRIIRNTLKLDPLNLPARSPGKPWVKAKVCEIIKIPNYPFQSKGVFDKAWSRLLEKKQLRTTTH